MQWRVLIHCLYLVCISHGGPCRGSTAGETPAPAKSTSANVPSPDAKTDSEASWGFFPLLPPTSVERLAHGHSPCDSCLPDLGSQLLPSEPIASIPI